MSKDLTLEEPFCCWACNKRPSGSLPREVYRTLWPTHSVFVWHWCLTQANALQKTWSNLANSVGIDASDLAFELLGIDLALWPLPWKAEAIASLPKRLPPKRGGHNPKIAGYPWYMQNPDDQLALVPSSSSRPKPPTYPPPSNLRSNKLVPSGLCPSMLQVPPAEVLSTGKGFNHQRSDDRTAMGWINPLKFSAWRCWRVKSLHTWLHSPTLATTLLLALSGMAFACVCLSYVFRVLFFLLILAHDRVDLCPVCLHLLLCHGPGY